MFHQGQLAVHGLAILLGRNEAGISNRGKKILHHAVVCIDIKWLQMLQVVIACDIRVRRVIYLLRTEHNDGKIYRAWLKRWSPGCVSAECKARQKW